MKQLKRSECAILPLVLKGKWYDMIASGEKREEYREFKHYWINRMNRYIYNTGCRRFVVSFSRGYQRAGMFFEVCGMYIKTKSIHPEWGEPETPHYVISLGERVELID